MIPLERDEPEWFRIALTAGVEEGSIQVNSCEIAFRRWGDQSNPGVVLVHGGRAHSRWWDHIAPMLAHTCCVAAIDLSGHGDSGRRSAYSYDEWAQEVLALASTTSSSLQAPVIIAHSMGGRVAVKAAANPGSRLTGVILIDTAPGVVTWRHRPANGPQLPHLYSSFDDARSHFRLQPAQSEVLPYVLDHVAGTSIRKMSGGWTWKFDPNVSLRSGDVPAETLAKIECRIALLRAERGNIPASVGDLFDHVFDRRVPVIDIPLAHHHIMMDQPLSLVTGIRSLLAEWGHGNYKISDDL